MRSFARYLIELFISVLADFIAEAIRTFLDRLLM